VAYLISELETVLDVTRCQTYFSTEMTDDLFPAKAATKAANQPGSE
jgi:hypothetical protein